MTKKLILLLCLSFTLPFVLLSLPSTEETWNAKPKVTSWDEAARLIDESIDETQPSFDWGSEPDNFYYLVGVGLEAGSFGDFAVNVWTGDVWDLWDCQLLSSPALQKSKAAILDRYLPRELKFYHQLHKLHPVCIAQ